MWNGTYCWIVRLVQVLQFKRLTASNISFALGHKKANGSCWWRGTHRTAWRCGSLCTPNFHTYSRFPKRSALHRPTEGQAMVNLRQTADIRSFPPVPVVLSLDSSLDAISVADFEPVRTAMN